MVIAPWSNAHRHTYIHSIVSWVRRCDNAGFAPIQSVALYEVYSYITFVFGRSIHLSRGCDRPSLKWLETVAYAVASACQAGPAGGYQFRGFRSGVMGIKTSARDQGAQSGITGSYIGCRSSFYCN